MAWLDGWVKRIKLDIDYTNKIGASVTWFPVTIFLKSGNGDTTKVFDALGDNHHKMAITQSDGTTELKAEVEQWDSGNKVGVLHTSLDGWAISADTSLYLYYGNARDDNSNIGDKGSASGQAVWDSNFKAIWHLDETSGTRYDSKGANNLTDNNTVGQANGLVGKCADFERDNQESFKINDNDDVSMGNFDWTIELLFKLETNGIVQHLIRKDDDKTGREYMVQLGTDNKITFGIPAGHGGTTAGTYNTATWYYIAFYLDYNSLPIKSVMGLKTYSTGVDTSDTTEIVGGFPDKTSPLVLGAEQYSGVYYNWLDGMEDEVRIAKTLRSAAWMKGTYNTLNDSLLTYGTEETIQKRMASLQFPGWGVKVYGG